MPTFNVYQDFSMPVLTAVGVQITADAVEITSTFPGDTVVTSRITWDEARSRSDACGFDRWTFQLDQVAFAHGPWQNLHTRTVEFLTPIPEFLQAEQKNFPYHIVVRPEDTSFLDSHFFINFPNEATLTCNHPVQVTARIPTTRARKSYWPQLDMAEISRDADGINVAITMAPNVSNQEIFLKTDVGYVPRKVVVEGGAATFRFAPVGMVAGETAHVKAGFLYFSNASSLNITV